MSKQIYAIEGLDRLGKSTLIEGIRNKLGYYEVIHFGKPQRLDVYERAERHAEMLGSTPDTSNSLFHYQMASFRNSMLLANSGARIIFDRWHLGEAVYGPMYRDTASEYVFHLEHATNMGENHNVRLILLWEDFEVAKHFVDDHQSLGAVENRQKEQELFISAFNKSIIPDKRMICVTDQALGGFKPKSWILNEALA